MKTIHCTHSCACGPLSASRTECGVEQLAKWMQIGKSFSPTSFASDVCLSLVAFYASVQCNTLESLIECVGDKRT